MGEEFAGTKVGVLRGKNRGNVRKIAIFVRYLKRIINGSIGIFSSN
jgi:hypothetical protein